MKYNVENYRSVAERLQVAGDLIQSVETQAPVMMSEVMGYVRATVRFTDGRHATGTASFRTDAKIGAQKTHPIEDAETSAIGRALAFLGIESSRSIASADEMAQVSERENLRTAAHMDKLIQRIRMYQEQAQKRGLVIEHDLDFVPLTNMTYDQIIEYGFYLKGLLNPQQN